MRLFCRSGLQRLSFEFNLIELANNSRQSGKNPTITNVTMLIKLSHRRLKSHFRGKLHSAGHTRAHWHLAGRGPGWQPVASHSDRRGVTVTVVPVSVAP